MIVAVPPGHREPPGATTSVTLGGGKIVTVLTLEAEQPLHPVAKRLYCVVDEGDTLMDGPLIAPGIQLYEQAPEAVSTVDPPTQRLGEFTDTVGCGSTTRLRVRVLLQVPLNALMV